MENRIGFVGIIIENPESVPRVNAILHQFSNKITGRIGVPDRRRGIAVIGLIVEGNSDDVGALTGRLGNLPDVTVKSALTAKAFLDA